jgi:hypothetical protein
MQLPGTDWAFMRGVAGGALVAYWHEADNQHDLIDVRFRSEADKHEV